MYLSYDNMSHDLKLCFSFQRDVLYDNLPQAGYVHFKFEPFVLHVTCKCLSHAKHMVHNILTQQETHLVLLMQLQAAVSSGFRNSGISVNRRERIVLVSKYNIHSDLRQCHCTRRLTPILEQQWHLFWITTQLPLVVHNGD